MSDEKKPDEKPPWPEDPKFTCTRPGRTVTTLQGAEVDLFHGDADSGDDYMLFFRRKDKRIVTALRLRRSGLEAVAYLAARELGWIKPPAETQEAPRG